MNDSKGQKSVDINPEIIYKGLKEVLPGRCQFTMRAIENMANKLQQNQPEGQEEIYELLEDILSKGSRLSNNQVWDLCAQISEMFDKLLGRIAQEEDETDTNDTQSEQKLSKEELKAQQLYQSHLDQIKAQKIVLPPARVKHDKSDTFGKTNDIMIDKLSIIVGGKVLLEDTQLNLAAGRKYGLIGRNGIGKTCLMNSLATYEFDQLPKHIQILLVEQEMEGSEKTPLDLVIETDGERTELLEKLAKLAESDDPDASQKLVDVNERLDQIDAQGAETRAQMILFGLGFPLELISRKTKHLSGGWRMRVSLARALFVKPDVLLLDEPTNHLDLDAVIWLEEYVSNCDHTVIIVSHDREFLNVVCQEMIHFYDKKITPYKGNYDMFEKTRSEKLSNQMKQYKKQQIEIAHMQSFVDRFRASAARASQAQSRVKALQKMELIEEVIEDPNCVFIFPEPAKVQDPLIRIEDGIFKYNDSKLILKDINFTVEMNSRQAIVGANGAGKTTLLNLLIDKLRISEGVYYKNQRVRIGLFTQHHIDQLNLMLTPLEQFQSSFPGSPQEDYRSHLSSFGLIGTHHLQPQYLLSGGQKSRVAFAMAAWYNPTMMILDEPTNHLDIDAVNALIIALNAFQGAIIIVSHDQYFVSQLCDEIWYIKNNRLILFKGDFDKYRKALIEKKL